MNELAAFLRRPDIAAEMEDDLRTLVAVPSVGAPGEGGDMIDWVIGVPSQAERKVLVESFRRAIDAAECIIEHGCQKAMNDFN